jgi:hypothetical protein
MAGGKLAERLEVEFGPFRSASSREPKCFLLTSIVQLLTERIFWTTPAATFRDLLKDLLVETKAPQAPTPKPLR